jgi:hypothetical protein
MHIGLCCHVFRPLDAVHMIQPLAICPHAMHVPVNFSIQNAMHKVGSPDARSTVTALACCTHLPTFTSLPMLGVISYTATPTDSRVPRATRQHAQAILATCWQRDAQRPWSAFEAMKCLYPRPMLDA